MSPILKTFYFSVVSVLYLFVISKLLGKKQISQLSFVDYVIGISLGSIAADMSVDVDTPIYMYLLAMTVFFVFSILITYVGRLAPFLKHLLKGKPITLIYDGKIDYEALKKSKLDVNDLLALCREESYFDVNDVAYAVLETNGQLSVLPKGNKKPVVAEDFNIEISKSSLTNYLVVDGKVSFSGLSELKKGIDWLYERLRITNEEQLKHIILATYDEESDEFNVHYKIKEKNRNKNQKQTNLEDEKKLKQIKKSNAEQRKLKHKTATEKAKIVKKKERQKQKQIADQVKNKK